MPKKITKESFGKDLGDVRTLFSTLQTEEDFKQFYLSYWEVIEEQINKEKGIMAGDQRALGEVFGRMQSNLYYLLSDDKMRSKFSQEIWWFLYV